MTTATATPLEDHDGCHSCHSLAPVAGLLCEECAHAVEHHGATVTDAYATECDCAPAVCSECECVPLIYGGCKCTGWGAR